MSRVRSCLAEGLGVLQHCVELAGLWHCLLRHPPGSASQSLALVLEVGFSGCFGRFTASMCWGVVWSQEQIGGHSF